MLLTERDIDLRFRYDLYYFRQDNIPKLTRDFQLDRLFTLEGLFTPCLVTFTFTLRCQVLAEAANSPWFASRNGGFETRRLTPSTFTHWLPPERPTNSRNFQHQDSRA